MTSRRRLSLPVLLMPVVFIAGVVVGWSGLLPNPISKQPPLVALDSRPFWETWRLVEDHYVDRAAVDRTRMTRGAIAGLLESLGDVGHTEYLSPEEVLRMEDELKGELEGIGVRVSVRRGQTAVVWVMPESPARKAGVLPGDVIVGVDGKEVRDKTLPQVVEQVLGPAGSDVKLTLARAGAADPVVLTIKRARLELDDVTWRLLPGQPAVAHIALQSFGEKALPQMKKALDAAQAAGARGLVIDLRGNPGGLRDTAVSVTSLFLTDGVVLVEQDAKGRRTTTTVQRQGPPCSLPLVVLVDEGTASSAEIFAGALQDHGRAKVVGTKTFGTGTVLQPFELSDGSAVLLAVSQWLTPNGRQIWHKGIEPDVAVALPDGANPLFPEEAEGLDAAALAKSEDVQLLKALEVLRAALPAGR